MDFQLLLTFLLGTISLAKNRDQTDGYEFTISVVVLILAGVPLLLHVVQMFRGQMRIKRLLDDLCTFLLSPSIKHDIFSWLYKRERGLYCHQPSRGIGTLAVEETCLCFSTHQPVDDGDRFLPPPGSDTFYSVISLNGEEEEEEDIDNGVSVLDRAPEWRIGASTMRIGDMLVEVVYTFLDNTLTTRTMYFDSTSAYTRTHRNYSLQALSRLLSVLRWWEENPTSGVCPLDPPKVVDGIAYKRCYQLSEIVRKCAEEGAVLVYQNNRTYATKFG